jgi:hypothetical protein
MRKTCLVAVVLGAAWAAAVPAFAQGTNQPPQVELPKPSLEPSIPQLPPAPQVQPMPEAVPAAPEASPAPASPEGSPDATPDAAHLQQRLNRMSRPIRS